MSIVLNDENFEKEILGAEKPALVDFWMESCPPCKMIMPILEKLTQELQDKIIFAKVNLDEAPLIVQKYGINAAPTIILFKKEKQLSGFVGLWEEKEIKAWLEENLLIQECQDYAEKNGLSLNPDKKIVEMLVKSLIEREKKFGKRYCPCRKISGDAKEDKKNICPCIYHLEEIKKYGHCLCKLFVKNV